MTDVQLVAFMVTMATATFLTRFLPFLLPKSLAESKFVYVANRILPPAILTLLVMYLLKDTKLVGWVNGLPEILTLVVLIVLHTLKRNALLSILVGTVL